MRKKERPIIIANWKMNKTNTEALFFLESLKQYTKELEKNKVIIAPPFTALSDMHKALNRINQREKKLFSLAAQNMHFENSGAFTGEISAQMLQQIGCEYVIIGHSERKLYFHENEEMINKKIKAALSHNLIPIVCFGETAEERKKKKYLKIIHDQIKEAFKNIPESDLRKIIISYEPIWAIGTGENALPLQVEEMHAFIRTVLLEKYSQKVSEEIKLLYGGSVTPSNTKSYMSLPDVNGLLVGNASLDINSFTKILKNTK